MMGMIRLLQRLLLIVFSSCLILVGLELAFRWVQWHQLSQLEREDDPVYHHRLKSHWTFHQSSPDFHTVATTNNLGLRGSRDYHEKAPGTRRLLMLGDSFTFGVGVNDDETFCILLQQTLNHQHAGMEVINAGIGSYSPLLHYLALRDLYLPLSPDAVILWFDFGDLQDDFHYERNLRYDASGRIIACNPHYFHGQFDWYDALKERSAMMKYFHNKFLRTYQKIRILGVRRYLGILIRRERAKAAIAKLQGRAREKVEALDYGQLLMIRDRANLPEIERHWQRTGKYILMIRDLLKQRHIPFALAAYPYGVQVGPDQWGKGREAFGFQPGVTYSDPFPFEFLARFAKDNDIPFIDTHESFLAAAETTRLYHDWDGHFTAAGQRVVAQHLVHDPVFWAFLTHSGFPVTVPSAAPRRQ